MIVTFRQTGGIAGVRRGCLLDTSAMGEIEAHRLIELVQGAGILKRKSTKQLGSAQDVFEYLIRITDGRLTCSAHFDDTTLPDSYRDLLKLLQEKSPMEP